MSQDALGALAVKYASPRNGKPKCSRCRQHDVRARVVLQVKLANNHPKSQRIVAGRMRSVFSGPGAATTPAHEAVSLSSPGRPVTSGPPRGRSLSGSAA